MTKKKRVTLIVVLALVLALAASVLWYTRPVTIAQLASLPEQESPYYDVSIRLFHQAGDFFPLKTEERSLSLAQGDPEKISAKIVFDAAREEDPIGKKVFRRYVSYLSQAIASIMQFLDPEIIVLGGGVSKAGAFLLDAVRQEVPKYLLFKGMPYARIELARLGADAGIIGAAMLGL